MVRIAAVVLNHRTPKLSIAAARSLQASRRAIQDLIVHAQQPREGILATILGTLVLLFGASGVFGELQDSLNTIWEVRPDTPPRLVTRTA